MYDLRWFHMEAPFAFSLFLSVLFFTRFHDPCTTCGLSRGSCHSSRNMFLTVPVRKEASLMDMELWRSLSFALILYHDTRGCYWERIPLHGNQV
jgi:hypothetical protein